MSSPPDWSRLEEDFKNAIGKLPDYKRRDAYAFVNALKKRIEDIDKELHELAEHYAKG